MKRFLILLLCIAILPCAVFSIGFGYHVLELKTSPEFGRGVFPSSLVYQFNFPMPDFIKGNITQLTFRLDNGVDFRTLYQDPYTGRYFSAYPEGDFKNHKYSDYSVHYDEYYLLFSQGFGKTQLSNNDTFTLRASFGGRFEKAYESFSWMKDKDNMEGTFWTVGNDGKLEERYPGASWVGTPELSGDRSYTSSFFDVGFDLDFYKDDIVTQNGVKLSSTFRYSPGWLLFADGKGDFAMLSNELSLAYTLFDIKQSSGLHWISLVLGNDLNYRTIWGEKVPYYALGGDIFGSRAVGANHQITNRTYITLYGPQIGAKDFYPYISIFHDFGFSFGKILNIAKDTDCLDYVGSTGIRVEFNIYNFFELFFEIGYVYKNQFGVGEDSGTLYGTGLIGPKFGFSLGI